MSRAQIFAGEPEFSESTRVRKVKEKVPKQRPSACFLPLFDLITDSFCLTSRPRKEKSELQLADYLSFRD